MRDTIRDPLLTIDNLLRTLMMAGAVLLTGFIIAHPSSWVMRGAAVTLVVGLLSFILASQFVVTLEMKDLERVMSRDDARDPRVAISFLCGYVAYVVSGVFLCIHFVTM